MATHGKGAKSKRKAERKARVGAKPVYDVEVNHNTRRKGVRVSSPATAKERGQAGGKKHAARVGKVQAKVNRSVGNESLHTRGGRKANGEPT